MVKNNFRRKRGADEIEKWSSVAPDEVLARGATCVTSWLNWEVTNTEIGSEWHGHKPTMLWRNGFGSGCERKWVHGTEKALYLDQSSLSLCRSGLTPLMESATA